MNLNVIKMELKRNQMKGQIDWSSLSKRMLLGALIALSVILFFMLQVNEPAPEWSKYWFIRPLIVTPMAGAAAGIFTYLMYKLRMENKWNKLLTIGLSLIGFLFILWVGIILGLDGTLWD